MTSSDKKHPHCWPPLRVAADLRIGRPGNSPKAVEVHRSVGCVLCVLALGFVRAADIDRPNVILIVADDMGYADLVLHCYTFLICVFAPDLALHR